MKAIYGLKSSGSRFHDLLPDVLNDMGLFPCKEELDIRMMDHGDHWGYVVTYIDDLLYSGFKAKECLEKLGEIGSK